VYATLSARVAQVLRVETSRISAKSSITTRSAPAIRRLRVSSSSVASARSISESSVGFE
jgi:hypothetical protein